MQVNPNRGVKDTFEKFKSNAIGDSYIDPGQYFLRSQTSKQPNVFKSAGGRKTVKKSEFEHMHNGPLPRPNPEKNKSYLTRSTAGLFQKNVPYEEDMFERKEDMSRNDYIKRMSKIIGRAYTTTVR